MKLKDWELKFGFIDRDSSLNTSAKNTKKDSVQWLQKTTCSKASVNDYLKWNNCKFI